MKKIIFVGYRFYGYEKEILEELNKRYEVYFIDITLNTLEKILYKFFKFNIIRKKIKKINKSKYDILLCFQDNKFGTKELELLKTTIKFDRAILYIWDDLLRVKNLDQIRSFFDKIYSFDLNNSLEENLIYRPTFYSERLKKYATVKILNKYNYFFIEEYRKYRLDFCNKLKKYLNNGYIFYYYNKFMLIRNKDIKLFFNKEIHIYPLDKVQYNEIFLSSKIVIDIPEIQQIGLSQRILDALYLEKKIITTNKNIKYEKFYNENNILIISKWKDFEKIETFIETSYQKVKKEIVDYYSIEAWVNEILEDKKCI